MVHRGCDTEAVFAALININHRRCRPLLDYQQLQSIAASIVQSMQPRPQGVLLEGDFLGQIAEAFAASGRVRLYSCLSQLDDMGWTVLLFFHFCYLLP
jgi:hypothetical protein